MEEILNCPFCEYETFDPDRLDEHIGVRHQSELNAMENENEQFKQEAI